MTQAVLTSASAQVTLLSLGAITQSWRVADGRNVVLGYDDPAHYQTNPNFLGVIAGRVANRIAGGRFPLQGKPVQLPCNDGPNHLHGGAQGLWSRNWTLDLDSAATAVRLTYTSQDGESGYPGTAKLRVTVTLENDTLHYDMTAHVDRPTPIALAQHSYYHLGAPASDTMLWLNADSYLPTDRTGLPLGRGAPVASTPYDFRSAAEIGKRPLDAHMVLNDGPIAATAQGKGLQLDLITDQPGLQLYSGHMLTAGFDPWQGFCLEPQQPPNAVNTDPAAVMVTPDRPYRQTTSIKIAPCA